MMVVESSLFRYFLFFAFFLTGATGLIYQVLWSRLLVLSFGYTIHSVTVVITAFMGGLALGSVLGGFIADRVRSTTTAYGLAEIGIGLIAVFTYPLLTWLPYLIADLREPLSIPYYGFNHWTFLISMLILVPPTLLMGLTLPLLARGLTRMRESAALDIGALYSVNTMGAAMGSIVAGFFLIAYFGVYTTLQIAASINILVGIGALLLNLQTLHVSPKAEEGEVSGTDHFTSILGEPIFWAFGISGFTALACEVVWIRIFSPYLENSTYAFALILGIFLAGIAFGGWAGRRVAGRMENSSCGFGACQLLAGILTGVGLLLVFIFIEHYHMVLSELGLLIKRPSIILEQSVGIFLIVIPSTFFMGAGFPFIAQWAGREFGRLGRRTGKLYAANTVGSIFGVLVGGFMLLPLLGTNRSIVFLVLLYCLNGSIIIYLNRKSFSYSQRTQVISCIILVAFMITLVSLPNPNLYALKSAYKDRDILAFREDPDVNVALLGKGNFRSLHVNLNEVSNSGTKITPWMSYLPLMMFADRPPSRMLNIGLGFGHTFTSALMYPRLKVDVVELVPSVAELFVEFNPRAEVALRNEGGTVIIGDGRSYLLSAKKPYDIIVIDPTPPLYGTGAVNLYTEDFFTTVRDKLSPKGLLLLRVPGSADDDSIKLILRTALEVFNHVSMWQPAMVIKNKTVLMGGFSIIASKFDYNLTMEEIRVKVVDTQFLSYYFKNLLLKTQPIFIDKNKELLKVIKDVPVVTDDRPYLEFPLMRR
jgi:spermidine synthase